MWTVKTNKTKQNKNATNKQDQEIFLKPFVKKNDATQLQMFSEKVKIRHKNNQTNKQKHKNNKKQKHDKNKKQKTLQSD